MDDVGVPSRRSGWYADPERPARLRWWNGTSWGADTIHPELHASLAVGVRRFGLVVIPILALVGLLDLVAAGLHAGALEVLAHPEDFEDRTWTEMSDQFDTLSSQVATYTLFAMMLASGVWAAWQYRLACMAPSAALRHSPEMHAGAWYIPVVNLWRPLLNMRDLWRALPVGDERGSRPPLLFASWWGLWVVSFVCWMVVLPAQFVADGPDVATLLLSLVVVGKLAGVAAARQAIVVVHRMSRRARTSAVLAAGGGVVPA